MKGAKNEGRLGLIINFKIPVCLEMRKSVVRRKKEGHFWQGDKYGCRHGLLEWEWK